MKFKALMAVITLLSAQMVEADDCAQFCDVSFWRDKERPSLNEEMLKGRDLDALLPVRKRLQFTLVQMAQLFYRWDEVIFLLEAGADPNVFNSRGQSLLAMVARQELSIHAHMGQSEREEIINKRMARIDYLLSVGADPMNVTKDGQSIIQYLASGDGFLIQPLASRLGIDVNDRDHEGWAPIHRAAADGFYGPVYKLAKAGADVNAAIKTGETPLHLAARQNHLNYNTVPALLEYGADPNILDGQGQTALHALVGGEEVDAYALDCLIVGGVDLNAQDHNGDTACTWPYAPDKADIASALMAVGADRSVVNNSGETAWDVFQNCPPDVVYWGGDPLSLRTDEPVSFEFESVTGFQTGRSPVCELIYRN